MIGVSNNDNHLVCLHYNNHGVEMDLQSFAWIFRPHLPYTLNLVMQKETDQNSYHALLGEKWTQLYTLLQVVKRD